MKRLLLIAAIVAAGAAQAHGFVDEPTCYSWSGGHKSAGSFTKCTPEMQAPKKAPEIVVNVAPAPVQVVTPSPVPPVMMPMCENPKPKHKPKPHTYHKPKPKPKKQC